MEFILYQILWCNMEWYVWHLPRRVLPKIWEEEGFTHFLRVWGYVTQITINVHEILKNFIGKLASMTKSTRTTTPKNSKKSAIHFSCFLIRAKHLSYHEWKKLPKSFKYFWRVTTSSWRILCYPTPWMTYDKFITFSGRMSTKSLMSWPSLPIPL